MNSLMLWGLLWDSCVAGSGPFFRRTFSDSCGTPVAAMTQLAIYKTNSPCSGKDEKQSLQHNVVRHFVSFETVCSSSRVTSVRGGRAVPEPDCFEDFRAQTRGCM